MTDNDLQHRLIEATVVLLRTLEPTELSLRHVARELGVSSGAPYHHFPDKAALLAAVAADGWRRLNSALAVANSEASADGLRTMAMAYLRFATTNPSHYRVMFLPELRDPARFAALHEVSSAALQGLVELVARIRQQPVESPELMQRVVGSWSTVHGFAVLTNSGVLVGKTDHVPPEDLLRGVAEASVRAALA